MLLLEEDGLDGTVLVTIDLEALTVTVLILTKEVKLTEIVTDVLLFGASRVGEETGTDLVVLADLVGLAELVVP